ncbi:LapA family protein [Ligilactobacillus sp. LYQ135]
MKKKLSLIGTVVLILVVAIFSILNIQNVSVNFFGASVKMPLVILIICSVLVGVLITVLFTSVSSFKNKRQIKHLNNRVEDLKKQVATTNNKEAKKEE